MIAASIAAAVPLRVAPPHEHQQARHERRVDAQVDRVAGRRERNLVTDELRIAVRVEVAEPEEARADDEAAPGEARAGRCSRMPTTIATSGASPSMFMSGPLPANGGTEHVERVRQRARGQVQLPRASARSCAPAPSSGLMPRERRGRVGGLSSPRSASSSSTAISASTSASVFAAVSCTRKPTSSFGTSG